MRPDLVWGYVQLVILGWMLAHRVIYAAVFAVFGGALAHLSAVNLWWLLPYDASVTTGLVLGAVLAWRPWTRWLAALLALSLLTFHLGSTSPVTLRAALSGLTIPSSPPRHADAIVALGAGIDCRTGQLTRDSIDRLRHGVALWQVGYAPTLVLSDTPSTFNGEEGCPSIARAQQALLQEWGVHGAGKVTLLPGVQNTHDEALATQALMRRNHWTRVLVVTSATHSRRVTLTFRRAGVSAQVVILDETHLLHTRGGRSRVQRRVLYEWAALVAYWWRGWL